MIKVINSNIVTAFEEKTIGSKVIDTNVFGFLLNKAIEEHDFSRDKTPGQGMLDLTMSISLPVLQSCVSGGIGKKTDNISDYIIRIYRGNPCLFLKRDKSEPVTSVRVLVYTKEAYINDPDVINDPEESKRIIGSDCTHVLVAVFAEVVSSVVSPFRFVANLAGGNRDYEKMTKEELVELAQKVKQHTEQWSTVAD